MTKKKLIFSDTLSNPNMMCVCVCVREYLYVCVFIYFSNLNGFVVPFQAICVRLELQPQIITPSLIFSRLS